MPVRVQRQDHQPPRPLALPRPCLSLPVSALAPPQGYSGLLPYFLAATLRLTAAQYSSCTEQYYDKFFKCA